MGAATLLLRRRGHLPAARAARRLHARAHLLARLPDRLVRRRRRPLAQPAERQHHQRQRSQRPPRSRQRAQQRARQRAQLRHPARRGRGRRGRRGRGRRGRGRRRPARQSGVRRAHLLPAGCSPLDGGHGCGAHAPMLLGEMHPPVHRHRAGDRQGLPRATRARGVAAAVGGAAGWLRRDRAAAGHVVSRRRGVESRGRGARAHARLFGAGRRAALLCPRLPVAHEPVQGRRVDLDGRGDRLLVRQRQCARRGQPGQGLLQGGKRLRPAVGRHVHRGGQAPGLAGGGLPLHRAANNPDPNPNPNPSPSPTPNPNPTRWAPSVSRCANCCG